MSTKRKWSINGDFVTLAPNGVARYAHQALSALDSLIADGHPLASGLDVSLIVPRAHPGLALRAIRIELLPEFRWPRLPQFWVQLQLARRARSRGLISFCNLAPITHRRQIVCIHDLHTWLMPESYGTLFRLAHKLILPRVGSSAVRVTTVSEHSRGHLQTFGIAPAKKISVTYNGCTHAKSWDARQSRLTLGPRPFVLFMARPQAYKNSALIWRIAPRIAELGLDVYVVGDANPEVIPSANIRLLGSVSDHDLALLFSRTLCFLFPSRIEGFGIPAVEAMVHGTPVVASSAPCLPEVCGDAALFADPDDDKAWINHIASLMHSPELRSRLIDNGRARAANFTWSNVAEHYLQLMANVDAEQSASIRSQSTERPPCR